MPHATTAALTLDDLVFIGRNQTYGAFDLRQHYRPTLNRALWLGVGLFLLGLLAPMLYTRLTPAASSAVLVDVQLTELAPPPDVLPVTVPPAEPVPVQQTVRALPPIVLPDADVVEETLPPAVEDFAEAAPGDKTVEGTGDVAVIQPPEEAALTKPEIAVETAPVEEAEILVVEQQPEYPGGLSALRVFLAKNLHYPPSAASAGVLGKVYVSFVVAADGSLSDVAVLKGIGFGCDEEATRVIRQMPRWKPGKQSGRAVRVKFNLPITFTLE